MRVSRAIASSTIRSSVASPGLSPLRATARSAKHRPPERAGRHIDGRLARPIPAFEVGFTPSEATRISAKGQSHGGHCADDDYDGKRCVPLSRTARAAGWMVDIPAAATAADR